MTCEAAARHHIRSFTRVHAHTQKCTLTHTYMLTNEDCGHVNIAHFSGVVKRSIVPRIHGFDIGPIFDQILHDFWMIVPLNRIVKETFVHDVVYTHISKETTSLLQARVLIVYCPEQYCIDKIRTS